MERCLLVAPLVSHATVGRIAALGSGAYALYTADTSTRAGGYRPELYPFSLIRKNYDLDVTASDPMFANDLGYAARVADLLRSRRLLPENRNIAARLEAVVDEVKPSVAVLYYGPSAIHFLRILKRIRPSLPVVIVLNLFPSIIEPPRARARALRRLVNNELSDFRHWLKSADFVVHASQGMADFALREYGVPEVRGTILPDYLSGATHVRESKLDGYKPDREPRVIFLGAPERWGNAIDNLDDELLAIARQHVHVYSGEMSQAVIDTGYGQKYPYFSDEAVFRGELASYAHGFDAALITYATRSRMERFRTTLPTRFFTALSAGIPLAVRAGMFDAVEEYVARNGIGFTYADARELREKLEDRDGLAAYRANALAHLEAVAAESQAPTFSAIFDRLRGADPEQSKRHRS